MDELLEDLLELRRTTQLLVESLQSLIDCDRTAIESDEGFLSIESGSDWDDRAELKKFHRRRIGVSRRMISAYRRLLEPNLRELARLDRRLAAFGVSPPASDPDPTPPERP